MAELCQKPPVIFEIDTEKNRNAEHALPVGYWIVPFKVSFTASITGGTEPFFYEWDFGDREFSSLGDPEHSFAGAGTFKIILTISDNDGAIAVDIKELTLPLPAVAPVEEAVSEVQEGSSQKVEDDLQEAEPAAGKAEAVAESEQLEPAAESDDRLLSATGLFYSDLKNFIKEMDVGNIVILLETPNDTKEVE